MAAKVTVGERQPLTPTQQVVAASGESITVTDSRGRIIEVKAKLTPVDRMRLARAAGKDADNTVYLSHAAVGFAVLSIDGHPRPRPTTPAQLEAVVSDLGDDGFEAVAAVFAETEEETDAIGAAKN